MKKIAASLLGLVFASTSAFGGTITFTPTSDSTVDPGGITTVTFDVSVSNDAGTPTGNVDLLIGSNDLAIVSFDYTQAAIDAFGFFITNPPVRNTDTYADAFSVGGFAPGSFAPGSLGILTVDAAGLAPGTYIVQVDSSLDGNFSNLGGEGAAGSGTVTVVPEPATLSLLGLAAVALVRRRKTA